MKIVFLCLITLTEIHNVLNINYLFFNKFWYFPNKIPKIQFKINNEII